MDDKEFDDRLASFLAPCSAQEAGDEATELFNQKYGEIPDDYPYAAPDLREWLMSVQDVSRLTLEQAFEAGERYGADLARESVYMSLPDQEGEAEEYGWSLVDYVRFRILEEMRTEIMADRSDASHRMAGEMPYQVIVNGKKVLVQSPLSYEAGVNSGLWDDGDSVTYQGKPIGDSRREGMLFPGGEPVELEHEMRFTAAFTGNA